VYVHIHIHAARWHRAIEAAAMNSSLPRLIVSHTPQAFLALQLHALPAAHYVRPSLAHTIARTQLELQCARFQHQEQACWVLQMQGSKRQ
jgi:hypothetical protein